MAEEKTVTGCGFGSTRMATGPARSFSLLRDRAAKERVRISRMADRHRAKAGVAAAQILLKQKNKSRLCVGIVFAPIGVGEDGVVRLDDDLVDAAEVQVFNQECDLLVVARKLLAEGEVDGSRGFDDDLQFLFSEFVVVDFHCFRHLGFDSGREARGF